MVVSTVINYKPQTLNPKTPYKYSDNWFISTMNLQAKADRLPSGPLLSAAPSESALALTQHMPTQSGLGFRAQGLVYRVSGLGFTLASTTDILCDAYTCQTATATVWCDRVTGRHADSRDLPLLWLARSGCNNALTKEITRLTKATKMTTVNTKT